MQDFIYLAVWIGCFALVLFALSVFNIRALAFSWAPSSRLAWLCLFITSDREKVGVEFFTHHTPLMPTPT